MLSNSEIFQKVSEGALAVIPTDTVYGVVASARDEAAVARLYELKSREAKPGTIIAANIQQLVDLGIPERYLKPIAHYWPNPISVIIPLGFKLEYLHQGKGSLAVRIPKDTQLQKLLEISGPLMTSSANLPGETPAANTEQAKAYFGDRVDYYLDGGELLDRQSSTVIRVVDDMVEVLRQGAIKINDAGEIQDETK